MARISRVSARNAGLGVKLAYFFTRRTIARYMEPCSLLVAQLAYENEGGPELAYRFERFAKQAIAGQNRRPKRTQT